MRSSLIALIFAVGYAAASILDGDLGTIDCDSDTATASDALEPDQCAGSTNAHGLGNDLINVIDNVQSLDDSFASTANTPFGCLTLQADPETQLCASVDQDGISKQELLDGLNLLDTTCSNGATARCGHEFLNGKDASGGVLSVQAS